MTGFDLILNERARQIIAEGFDFSYDTGSSVHDLCAAADAYKFESDWEKVPESWPWGKSWWKPTTPLRNLSKAGALYMAAMDRIQFSNIYLSLEEKRQLEILRNNVKYCALELDEILRIN